METCRYCGKEIRYVELPLKDTNVKISVWVNTGFPWSPCEKGIHHEPITAEDRFNELLNRYYEERG